MRRFAFIVFLSLVSIAHWGQTPWWQYDAGQPISFDPAVARDGSVYFSTDDGKLHGLNSNGIRAWSVKPGGQVITPIALQGLLLYFGNSAQELRCYSTAGNLIWKRGLPVNIKTPLALSGDGKIYFATQDGYLNSVQSGSGVPNWRIRLGEMIQVPSVGHDGTVYVSVNNFVHAINPNGAILWSKNFFNASAVPIVLDQYDHLFYNRGGILDVYDKNGNILWEGRDATGNLLLCQKVPPAIFGDTLIIAKEGGGEIYGIDVSSGTILWQYSDCPASTNYSVAATQPLTVDRIGTVIFCDDGVEFVYIDGTTGCLLGYIPTNEQGGAVALVGRGAEGVAVYRGNHAKSILAYKHWAGPGEGPWCQPWGSAGHLLRRDDPPQVSLVNPVDLEVITGEILLEGYATDDFKLVDLTYYVNGTMITRCDTSCMVNLDTSNFQDGPYRISAVARDSGGNEGYASADVVFTNPAPSYDMYEVPPTFGWLPNGDTKYQVTISTDPNFTSTVVTSKKGNVGWLKTTTWNPTAKQWSKVQAAATADPNSQVRFYWKVMGKTTGVVTSRYFFIQK